VLQNAVCVKTTLVGLTHTGSEFIKFRILGVDLKIARNMSNFELTVVMLYGCALMAMVCG
jgi:hypothetical protein